MKKKSNRVIFLVFGLIVLVGLVAMGAVATTFAYRQFTRANDGAKAFSRAPEIRIPGEPGEFVGRLQEDPAAEDGVVVMYVDPDSPAAAAGLTEGSIILEVDGEEIQSPTQLQQIIRDHAEGDMVTLKVQNGDRVEEIQVTLASAGAYLGVNVAGGRQDFRFGFRGEPGQLPHEFEMPMFPHREGAPGGVPEGFPEGFHDNFPEGFLEHLPDDFLEQLPEGFLENFPEGFPEGFHEGQPFMPEEFRTQVMIGSVVADSPAAEAGLQEGDIIQEIDGETIDNQDQLVALIAEKGPGDKVELTIFRDHESSSITVTLGSHPEEPERGYLGVHLQSLGFRFHYSTDDNIQNG